MAITTSDGLVAAIATAQREPLFKAQTAAEGAGTLLTYLWAAGRPGAITTPSPGVNGEAVSSSMSGFIPYINAGVGNQKYLASVEGVLGVTGSVIFADMLWWNSGINVTTTTEQTISAATASARDVNGSSNGAGVEAGILVSTATTNGSAVTNTTFKYTNSAGATGKVGAIPSFPQTCVAGTLVPFTLAAGDTGVRAIESVTLGTSYGGGAIHLVLFRRLTILPIPVAFIGSQRNFFDIGTKVYDNSAIFPMTLCTSATAGQFLGQITFIEG